MLDIENSSESNEPTGATEATKPATEKAPTRRRRAASRPAGTPEATQAAETPAAEAAPAESAPVEADVTPKRRRATTKPAAEKAPTRRRKVAVPSEEAAEAPVTEAPAVETPVAEAPTEQAEEPTKPVRRRATRKTAPPAEVASPFAEPTTEAPATEAPAAEAPAAEAAPKTRRRATKPKAEPVVEAAAVEAVVTEASPVAEVAPVETAPVEQAEAQDEAPKAPARRRRATRAAAAPVHVEAPVAKAVEPSAPAPAVEASPAEIAPAEQAEAQDEAPKAPVRRRRATRAAAAPAPVEAPAVAEAPAAEEEPEAVQAVEEQVVEETPEPTQPRARGRRRASRPAAAPTEAPADEDDDPIGAALRAAEDLAEARKSVLADPFMTKEARDAQLAALAGAIAADDAADDDEDEDDEESTHSEDAESHEDDDTSDDESGDDDSGDDDSSDEDGDRPARRRRRRGGRRRRRGGPRDEDDNDEQGESNGEEESHDEGEESSSDDDSDDQDHSEGEGDSSSTTRRRRRRRRRGDSDKEGASDNDEVTGIEGSTRMEAKRQRRKESRAAGRRRAPILSEAEFLARRESVDRTMVIRQSEDYTQLAVIEDDILVEHYVDKASATSLIGNIYLGKVQNVLPSMEAAFIDIGRGRNAVLYAGEVDWASFGVTGENRKVENVLKSGQSVLVQVTKDPVGAKGARLTSHISLPGRYIVYSPGGHLSGISRKLPDSERQRLRSVLGHLISDEESVIVRTAAEGVSEDELVRDVNRLKAQWEVIEKKSKQGGAPQALYAEPDLTLRIVRDLFTEDFGHLIVQGNGDQDDAFDAISAYVGHVAPHLLDRVERFDGGDDGKDVFSKFRVDEQIAKALDRKVYLPSGGSLVIDRTEAMTVIDVNTGRFTGSAGNLEATVTSNNLEAAEEIVRQLRLRDLGGIIVIDFIDMVLPSNRDLLLRRLVECLGRDRTRHQVAEVTSLGLVQLTRKRIGTGLQEAFTEQCEHCHGAGYLRFGEPVDSQAPADGGDRRSNGRRRRK